MAFYTALIAYGYSGNMPTNWMQAFSALKDVLEKRKQHSKRRIVFIDELPCFDTPKSGFVKALDFFWNSWASRQKDIFIVVCGSATSWIIKNIIDNHGGLHNRITHEMYLKPFTLKEVELYLKSRGAISCSTGSRLFLQTAKQHPQLFSCAKSGTTGKIVPAVFCTMEK